MAWYHINRRMLVYKAWYFFSISAMSITPFLSLHLKQYGMSPFRIGLLSFLKYGSVTIFTPIIGVLMDTFRRPKLFVVTTGAVWIASVLVVGLITPQPQQKSCEVIRERLDYEYDQCSMSSVVDQEDPPVNDSSAATLMKSFDHYGVEKYMQCQSLNEALSADRTWLYTSDSLQLVFYIFAITFCLMETNFQVLRSIADAELVNALEDMGMDIADYGNQRAIGSLGWAIMPVLYGLYITYTRDSVSICGFVLMIVNYSPMFWVFLGMAIITMITMKFFSLEYKTKSSTSADVGMVGARQVLSRLCTLPTISVIIVFTFTTVCNATANGYVFWHLDNINGNELVMGLMLTWHGVSALVIGYASGAMIRQFGHFRLLIVGTLTYLVRFIIYAFVTEPLWFMVTEILHSLSYILTWNVTLSYLSLFIPDEYRTSLAIFLNSIDNGLGAAAGFLLSGYLIEIYGAVVVFKIYAGLCAAVAVLGTGVFLYTTSSDSNDLRMQPMIKYQGLNDGAISIQQEPYVPPVPEYLHEYQQPTCDDSSDVSS